MSTLKPDIQEEDSDYHSETTLPGDVAEVAVASVMFEMIGARERYWLSPSGDGESRYELWSEADLMKGCFTCCVWLEDCEGHAASSAAEQLLEALWMRRSPVALCLISFKEAGLVAMNRLKKLRINYEKRLKPAKAPKLARTLRGELHREDGTLEYRGELRGKVPHGKGTTFWGNGKVACEGNFEHRKPHGHCRMYFSSGHLRYEGQCVEGLPEGSGKEYRESGIPWFEGFFGKQSYYYYHGARVWIKGRLFDDKGKLVHEGGFDSTGKHSSPVRETEEC